ncbi:MULTISPECIES: hypothetical protein [Exiguobacterium]|uniref:hypothetical protein n=1 Tax=Exiguobacterium TaxID=33986 RepID=UPI000877A456|nr:MULTISPECIES: hypothetical protein [Exiguobacterium]OGX79989.1 hypothetical protein A6395_03820 [Exiguobacterium sp. SH31]TCI52212.1 hypothetical protein EVJ24_11575 [Exiguobacterium sp. SH1S21]TCI61674.1 hypothetical protein EVJ21_10485 [Exiguobacterium sp. SH0S2]TCI73358.1 hypothetical protein EVJ22_02880 [Exiguobacterium sp. SH0S7]
MTNQHSDDEYEAYDEDRLEFDPYFSHEAKMEVSLNAAGVNFVGNAEGYLALARMFTFLAETHMSIRMEENPSPDINTSYGYGPYHMTDYIRDKFIQNKQYVFDPGALHDSHPEHEKELFFWLSDQIGPDFWVENREDDEQE